MALSISVEQVEETADEYVCVFGGPDTTLGRMCLRKDSGAVEIESLRHAPDGPNTRMYLAHVVERLQAYHTRGVYPTRDEWTV